MICFQSDLFAGASAADDSVWRPVAVALLVLLALVVIFAVAVCCRLRRRVAKQELEAPRKSSAGTHPALSSSPSPSLAEAKSRHDQRYSTLLASDAVAVPNGHSKNEGGGHRCQASRDLSGLPDLAPPPLPSTSPPSLPHHPDGASHPAEAVDVRRTLEWRDNSCHADAKDPQENPWSSTDDGEGDYADPKELETPPWLRIQGADDDEEHDYADPRELEKPAWLLAQDDDDYHDYEYIDRDALRVLLDKDREETQRSMAAEEGRLSRHDSENSLYEEIKALEAARESRALEERSHTEQQREQQKCQERRGVEEQQQRDEKEKRQQEEEEEQDQNEQIQHNQTNELQESEQDILESGQLEAN